MPFPALALWGLGGIAAAYGAKKLYNKVKQDAEIESEYYNSEKEIFGRLKSGFIVEYSSNDYIQGSTLIANESNPTAIMSLIYYKYPKDSLDISLIKSSKLLIHSTQLRDKVLDGFRNIAKRLKSRSLIFDDFLSYFGGFGTPKYSEACNSYSDIRSDITSFLSNNSLGVSSSSNFVKSNFNSQYSIPLSELDIEYNRRFLRAK